jgi:hypothetical protein
MKKKKPFLVSNMYCSSLGRNAWGPADPITCRIGNLSYGLTYTVPPYTAKGGNLPAWLVDPLGEPQPTWPSIAG